MAGSKEIRTKIKSVQSTRKITKAMEMVSASKMRKAQERMRAGAPLWGKDPQRRCAHFPRQPRVPPSVPDRARLRSKKSASSSSPLTRGCAAA
jgi:hypothetical protein